MPKLATADTSPLLSETIGGYLAYMRDTGAKPTTIKSYRSSLTHLFTFVGDTPIESVTPQDVDSMLGQMQQSRKYKPSTINGVHSILSGFFRYCRDRGVTAPTFDPLRGRRYLKVPPTPKARIGVDDFHAALDAATYPRDRALLAVGLFTMLRSSEIETLTVGDVGDDTLHVNIWKSDLTDDLPIPPDFRIELDRWLAAYEEECGPLQPHWRLVPCARSKGYTFHHPPRMNRPGDDTVFPARPKERLVGAARLARRSTTGYDLHPTVKISHSYEFVKEILESIGITGYRMGMHALRRSAARAMFDELSKQGRDDALRYVSAWLHHKSTTTTEIYLGLDVDREKRDAHFATNPMFPSIAKAGRRGNLRVVESA